jgi:beta-galactosidase
LELEIRDNFVWGAATAAYQVEGAVRADGRGPSVWDLWSAIPGRMNGSDTGDVACDQYNRWQEDVKLMQDIGLRSYRLSLSWSRIMPEGRGAVNTAGLDHYERVVDGLLSAGIAPLITLYHWDLPASLQFAMGGWLHSDSAVAFADYAETVFKRLGDRVKLWLTLNEPWVVVDAGYFQGIHPPGVSDRRLGYRAGHNLLRAHAYAVERFRRGSQNAGAISFALNTTYSYPATPSAQDAEAAQRAMLNFAGWFTDPPHFGDYPAVMRERLGDLLPAFTDEDSRLLKRSMDFLALNFYFADVVKHAPGNGAMEYELVPQPQLQHTEMGWPVTPDGLYQILHWLHRRYDGLPVYVTENGAACDDKPDGVGFVEDRDRIAYLRDHILAARRAMREGVDLRGYYVWSLLDNLEWTLGYSKRFGLIHCDRRTLKRTMKASAHWYAKVIADGVLSQEQPEAITPPALAGSV